MKNELFVLDAWGGKTDFDPEVKVNFNRVQLVTTVAGGAKTVGFHVDRFAGFYQGGQGVDEAQPGRGNMTITLKLASGALFEMAVPDFLSTKMDQTNHMVCFQGDKTLAMINFDYFYHYSFQPAGQDLGTEQRSTSAMTQQNQLHPRSARITLTPGGQADVPNVRELYEVTNFTLNAVAGLLLFTHQGGEFGLRIDMLRCFEVRVAPQAGDVVHKTCRVVLTPIDGHEPVDIQILDVIKESWDTNNGLLMIYAKEVTMGFHLDHVVSYQV